MMLYFKNYFLVGGTVFLFLYACSSSTLTSQQSPAVVINVDEQQGWKKIGVSLQGQLMSEIKIDSLKRSPLNNNVEFQEKRTVLDPVRAALNRLPYHQYSINTWRIDCDKKTYQLLSMALFDDKHQNISQSNYQENDIQPMAIVSGSVSAQHLAYVCR